VGGRLTHSSVPYVLVDGTRVADDWDDLVDGALDHPIDLDEHGNPHQNDAVWTATNSGGLGGYYDCSGWTGGIAAAGVTGATSAAGGLWTHADTFHFCNLNSRLYCFEQ